MKKKLRMLKRRLERAGGTIMISENMPDSVAERFLHEMLNCPDCAEALAAERKRRDASREH